MLKRILTSLLGLVVFFAVFFSHQYVIYGVITIITLLALVEMYRMMDTDKALYFSGLLSGLAICVGQMTSTRVFTSILVMMIYGFFMIFLHGRVDSKKVMTNAFITLFISVFMSNLISIRRLDKYILILPFVCAWLSDTGAYFVGSLMGKHKLCEKISPKKTIEGAVGGLLLSALGCVGFITVMTKFAPNMMAIVKFAIIGLVAGAISQFGDLVFSCIKRDFGKKDYGSILPGHGGILDRFDSVIFIVPFIYYVIQYVIK